MGVTTSLSAIERTLSNTGVLELSDITALPERRRSHLQDLLRIKESVLSSCAEQVRIFNEVTGREWGEVFQQMGNLQEVDGSIRQGDSLRNLVWKSVPNCPFKRFQEAFCHASDYVVPKFTIKSGRVEFCVNPKSISVLGCLVSPLRISDELSKLLGVSLESHGKPLKFPDKVHAKSSNKLILDLKTLWTKSRPLAGSVSRPSLRVVRVEPAYSSPSTAILERAGGSVPIAARGVLLVSQEGSHEKSDDRKSYIAQVRPLVVHIHRSAHSALRRTKHIDFDYLKFARASAQIEEKLESMIFKLDSQWSSVDSTGKGELISEAKANIEKALLFVKRARHPLRVHATNLISGADFQDSKGRVNVTRAMTKLAAGLKAMRETVAESGRKTGFVRQDHLTLEHRISSCDAMVEALDHNLVEVGSGVVSSETPTAISKLKPVLDRFTKMEQQITDPYLAACTVLERLALRLSANPPEAIDAIVKMHMVCKFLMVHRLLENLKDVSLENEERLLSGHQAAPVESVRILLAQLKEVFGFYSSRQIFKKFNVDQSYSAPYYDIRDKLRAIGRRLTQRVSEELSLGQVVDLLAKFRSHIDNQDVFNIAQIIKKLP